MKKKHIIRESKHIVAMYAHANKTTGYCIRSKSNVTEAVRFILKLNWVESVAEHDGFIFVKPTEKLLNLTSNNNLKKAA